MIEASIYFHDYFKFFFPRLVVDCWKENWRSLLRGASPPSTRPPRSINLIITIALIIIIVSFALL